MMHPAWPHRDTIADFSYSKLPHFDAFRGLPFQSYNVGDPDPAICDLKVYQDYLVYCFIRRNVPPGARILEVGGGDSRILRHFAKDYECWNVDKCEGLGNGPIRFTSPDYRIVYDYLGTGNPELPDHYFDLVFSISALEHTPEDPAIRTGIAADILRVLKPGAPSFHCFDIILRDSGIHWFNGLIPYLHDHCPVLNPRKTAADILADPETYYMSQAAYEASWEPILKIPYTTNGRPLSYNLLWYN